MGRERRSGECADRSRRIVVDVAHNSREAATAPSCGRQPADCRRKLPVVFILEQVFHSELDLMARQEINIFFL